MDPLSQIWNEASLNLKKAVQTEGRADRRLQTGPPPANFTWQASATNIRPVSGPQQGPHRIPLLLSSPHSPLTPLLGIRVAVLLVLRVQPDDG